VLVDGRPASVNSELVLAAVGLASGSS
jgi:hypothetical protein